MLERLPDPPQIFTARISGDTDGFEHPTDSSLSLALGAQVMMLTSDGASRWVNGTLGRITAIGTDDVAIRKQVVAEERERLGVEAVAG